MNAAGRFMRLDLRQLPPVAALGMVPTVTWLGVNAGRSGKSQVSGWGAMGLHKHLGIPRARGREALRALERAGLLATVRPKLRAIVESDAPEYAWLPQAVLFGVAGERPPVHLLRESGDVLLLRLFLELYGRHELPDDGGLPLRVLSKPWERRVICRRQAWAVVGFTSLGTIQTHLFGDRARTAAEVDPLALPHVALPTTKGGRLKHDDWFRRCKALIGLGLVQEVPRLMESADTDALLACSLWPWPEAHDVPAERQVAQAAQGAAEALMGRDDEAWARYTEWGDERSILLAVPAHMADSATLVSGFRLRYRPATSATTEWWAAVHTQADEWTRRYEDVTRQWSDASAVSAGAGR